MKLPRSNRKVSLSCHKFMAAAISSVLLVLVSAASLHSQSSTSREVTPTPSEADYVVGAAAQNVKIHARPSNIALGRKTSAAAISNSPAGAAGPRNVAPDSGQPRFPGGMSFHGGNVVVSVQHHAIYMNPNGACTIASCWGDPERFLIDLGKSEFIHIVDQYTGSTADDRYTVSNTHTMINYKPNGAPFTDADMRAVVHAAAAILGVPGGYGNEFHVFLPPGQDECMAFNVCYSPDDPKAFAFCAYHSSADFSDIGHFLYSVEPFQNNSGCSSRPGTPNGQLADSTNNSLSHEVFETITDPDGTAWLTSLDNGIFGEEIGDECSFLRFTTKAIFFDSSDLTLDGKRYVAQPEYGNAQHACTTSP